MMTWPLSLPPQPLHGHRNPFREVHRREAGVAHLFLEQIAGESMEVNRSASCIEWIDVASEERGDHAAEDVAHAAAGHARIAGRIHIDMTFGVGDERLMAFENHDAIALSRRLACGLDPVSGD